MLQYHLHVFRSRVDHVAQDLVRRDVAMDDTCCLYMGQVVIPAEGVFKQGNLVISIKIFQWIPDEHGTVCQARTGGVRIPIMGFIMIGTCKGTQQVEGEAVSPRIRPGSLLIVAKILDGIPIGILKLDSIPLVRQAGIRAEDPNDRQATAESVGEGPAKRWIRAELMAKRA